MAALGKGLSGVSDITSDIYPANLKRGLRPSAERNVSTHLKKLIDDGIVQEAASAYSLK